MKVSTILTQLDITDANSRLIRPMRAVYGAANTPAIWLKDISNVISFFDDILIYASDFENMISLRLGLRRVKEKGLRLNKPKCVWNS